MAYIDLHVHTSFGSPCAELLKPATLPDAMIRRRIHGIVITEHNLMWPYDEIRVLNRHLPPGYRIYSGVEVSTSRFHVVAIGLDSMTGITHGIHPEKLVDIARRCRAATILVHPFDTFPDMASMQDIPDFDGIEVASTMTCGEKRMKTFALCHRMNAVPVGGSDAHCSENIGKVLTEFSSLPNDEKELADQIRKGFCRPMIMARYEKEAVIC